MVLTQTDVADLSVWYRERRASLVKIFTERIAERKAITKEREAIKEVEQIVENIKKHKLLAAKKKMEKFLGKKGSLEIFLRVWEEVTNFNFKLISAVAFAVDNMNRTALGAEARHLIPEKMAEEAKVELKKRADDMEQDMHIVRLMAQKVSALLKTA